MCYDVKAMLKTQLKRARREKDEDNIRDIEEKLTGMNYYYVSGFTHPKLLIYTNVEPDQPTTAIWGLIPHWAKDKKDIWNKTLNARSETIFEKPSFRDAANSNRCLIYVDGFYEHQHFNGLTYPYFIKRNDSDHLILAGLWNDWEDKMSGEIIKTFTILTTKANTVMAEIHNSPDLDEPRMPFFLDENLEQDWLKVSNQKEVNEIASSVKKYEIEAHTVRRLKGKNAIGNVKEASEKFLYPELNPPTLF